jgi:hypothetical protein
VYVVEARLIDDTQDRGFEPEDRDRPSDRGRQVGKEPPREHVVNDHAEDGRGIRIGLGEAAPGEQPVPRRVEIVRGHSEPVDERPVLELVAGVARRAGEGQ